MKDITIKSYRDLYDATIFLEEEIERYLDLGYDDIKGEISLIDGSWRVGVTMSNRQWELDV